MSRLSKEWPPANAVQLPEALQRRASIATANLEKAVTPQERNAAVREAHAVMADLEKWQSDRLAVEMFKIAHRYPQRGLLS